MPFFGKAAIFFSILLVLISFTLAVFNESLPLGRLPGDITFEEGATKFYIPFSTGLVISGVLSAVIFLVTILL